MLNRLILHDHIYSLERKKLSVLMTTASGAGLLYNSSIKMILRSLSSAKLNASLSDRYFKDRRQKEKILLFPRLVFVTVVLTET